MGWPKGKKRKDNPTGPNKVRQIGRYDDETWDMVKAAAEADGAESVAAWVRELIFERIGKLDGNAN